MKQTLRKIKNFLMSWAEMYGTVRAAAHLAHLGKHKEAQELMNRIQTVAPKAHVPYYGEDEAPLVVDKSSKGSAVKG